MGKRAIDIQERPDLVIAQRTAISLLGLSIRGEGFRPGKSNLLAIEKAKRIDRSAVTDVPHPTFPDHQTFKRAWKGQTRIQPNTVVAIQFWVTTPTNFESLLRIESARSKGWAADEFVTPFVRALHCMCIGATRKRELADQEKLEAIADVSGFLLRRLAPDKRRLVTLPGMKLSGLGRYHRKVFKRERTADPLRRELKATLLRHDVPVHFQSNLVYGDWYKAASGSDPRCVLRCLLEVSLDPRVDLHLSPALLRWTIDLATAVLCVQAKLLSEDKSDYGMAEFGYARAITTLAHLLWDGDAFANDYAITRMFDRLHLEPSEANGQRIIKCIATLRAGAELFRDFFAMLGIDRYLLWTAWNNARKMHGSADSATIGEPQRSSVSAMTSKILRKLPLHPPYQMRRKSVEGFRQFERQCSEAVRRNPAKFASDKNSLKRERKAFNLAVHFAHIRHSKNPGSAQETLARLQSELELRCPSFLEAIRSSFDVSFMGKAESQLSAKPSGLHNPSRSDSRPQGAYTGSRSASTGDRSPPISASHPNETRQPAGDLVPPIA